jgi:polar amino acid transport system substrate-binding protein
LTIDRPKRPIRLDRRQFAFGAALTVLDGLSTSPVRADTATLAPDIKKIKDRGQLVVAMTNFDSPPFYYQRHKDGNDKTPAVFDGMDVQLATEIAKSLEVELVVNRQANTFNGVVDLVQSGDADMAISKLSLTAKRAMNVLFTSPTIELRHALLANRVELARSTEGRPVQSVINHGFAGTIGVIAHSSFADTARQLFTNATIREIGSWDDVVDAVNTGTVDIAYRDELEIKRVMRLRPELHLNVRSVLIGDRRDIIAIALPWQSSQLTAFANVILRGKKRLNADQLLDQYADMFPPQAPG